jgi:phosphoribosylformimino-5-aminoimidazole carboxamide ribotide isomerase
VLSLDFRDRQFLGPRELLTETDAWPAQVIVMSLARVGGISGPDLERIEHVRQLAGGRQLFAAGGVRDGEDITRLAESGAAGVLAASVLHKSAMAAQEIFPSAPP